MRYWLWLLLGCASHAMAVDRVFQIAIGEQVHCTSAFGCTAIAECPSGTVAWGGGGYGDQAKLESSYPAFNAWVVGFRGAYHEYASTAHANMTPYAICSEPLTGGSSLSTTQIVCDHDGPSCTSYLSCPNGQTILSGGMSGQEAEIESSYPFNISTWVVSWYPDYEDFGSAALGSAIEYATCADNTPDGFALVDSVPILCDHDGPSCTATVMCPGGAVLFGGGFAGFQSKAESFAPLSSSWWYAAWYPASYEYASTAEGSGSAAGLCAAGRFLTDSIFADGFDL